MGEIFDNTLMRTEKFMSSYYSDDVIKESMDYAFKHNNTTVDDKILELALEKTSEKHVAEIIEMALEEKQSDKTVSLMLAFASGVDAANKNGLTNTGPTYVSDYCKQKDFAVFFLFGDNDFGGVMENAASLFCKEYNGILKNINIFSKDEEEEQKNHPDRLFYRMSESYIKDVEYMEDPERLKELLKTLFLGSYLNSTADRMGLFQGHKPTYTMDARLEESLKLTNELFRDGRFWVIGSWETVNKCGMERVAGYQSESNAPKDLTECWINGEALIMRMCNGKLTYEVR